MYTKSRNFMATLDKRTVLWSRIVAIIKFISYSEYPTYMQVWGLLTLTPILMHM